MKFTLEINLGNDAMQTEGDVATALEHIRRKINWARNMEAGDRGTVYDRNGNTVGHWQVQDDQITTEQRVGRTLITSPRFHDMTVAAALAELEANGAGLPQTSPAAEETTPTHSPSTAKTSDSNASSTTPNTMRKRLSSASSLKPLTSTTTWNASTTSNPPPTSPPMTPKTTPKTTSANPLQVRCLASTSAHKLPRWGETLRSRSRTAF